MDEQSLETQRLIRAFIPSPSELILLPAFSLFFLALSSGYVHFTRTDDAQYELVSHYLQSQLQAGLARLDRLAGATVPTAIFWAFVGLVVYLLVWLLIGAYHAYQADVPKEKGMILPRDYNRAAVVRSSIAHLCIRVLALGILILWFYLLLSQILPYTSSVFLDEFSAPTILTPLYCLGATALLAAWLFVIAVLSRCMVLRDRVFTT